jgi:hypothetical protein
VNGETREHLRREHVLRWFLLRRLRLNARERGGEPTVNRTPGRWTRYFVVAGATAALAWRAGALGGVDARTRTVFALLGFVFPTVFGMAWLLFPAYVGRTLPDGWWPGVTLLLSVGGAGLFGGGTVLGRPAVASAGVLAWVLGVASFLAVQSAVVVPAVRETGPSRLLGRLVPAARVATAVVPVAVGYLAVGSGVLLLARTGDATRPAAVHLLALGFGALLVYALGVRLLAGFFHVGASARAVATVLAFGAVGPAVLATNLWIPPWFAVGALASAAGMVGYALVVADVFVRAERRRVGLYGVLAGAAAGVVAVAVGTAVAALGASPSLLSVHFGAGVGGFFHLTVVGYLFLFFPPQAGSFTGASERAVLGSILLLAAGVALELAALLLGGSAVAAAQAVVFAGTLAVWYLLVRTLL